jgi:hypothetical protein
LVFLPLFTQAAKFSLDSHHHKGIIKIAFDWGAMVREKEKGMRKEARLKLISTCLALLLFGTNHLMARTWTTLDMPGSYWTRIYGIDGSNLVGYYCNDESFKWHGCIYNLNTHTWTTLDKPGASRTYLYGIGGDYVVGVASYQGFIYNMKNQTWTTVPSYAYGTDGINVVGGGFVYNMVTQSWINLSHPGATYIDAYDVSNSTVVGRYMINNVWHGFLYNIDTNSMTQFDKPNAWETSIYGIDGSNLVGAYVQGGDYGFLYNMTTQTWTTLQIGARGTYIHGIQGNNLVGAYEDSAANYHGFIYTVPEPATLLLLGLGVVMLRKHKNKTPL